ncbi:unnamed protein product [Lepidochelys kempii]
MRCLKRDHWFYFQAVRQRGVIPVLNVPYLSYSYGKFRFPDHLKGVCVGGISFFLFCLRSGLGHSGHFCFLPHLAERLKGLSRGKLLVKVADKTPAASLADVEGSPCYLEHLPHHSKEGRRSVESIDLSPFTTCCCLLQGRFALKSEKTFCSHLPGTAVVPEQKAAAPGWEQ